jgi:hypothetical protein
MDETGQVLGIATLVSAEGQNLNFAIAVEKVSAALMQLPRELSSTPAHKSRCTPAESGCSGGLHSIRWHCVFEEARCEVFCKNRSKNGSGNHQHEDHIEQPAIDQTLTGGVSSIEGD